MNGRVSNYLRDNRIEDLVRHLMDLPAADLSDVPSEAFLAAIEWLCLNLRPRDAAAVFRQSVAGNKKLGPPIECLRALALAGDIELAMSTFRLANVPPGRALQGWLAMANILSQIKQHEAAFDLLTEIDAKVPDNPFVKLRYGVEAFRLGKRHFGADLLRHAQSLKPQQPGWVPAMLSGLQNGIVTVAGIRLRVPEHIVSAEILFSMVNGFYEKPEREALLADLHSEDRVLELGSGLGALAIWAKRAVPDVAFTCVEANPDLIGLINTNLKENGCQCDVIAGAAALSDGEADFFVSDDFWASTSYKSNTDRTLVKVRSLDTNRLIRETKPTIMAIDIEGAEVDVVPGLDLSGIRRVVIELHPEITGAQDVSNIMRHLLDSGFALDLTQARGQVYVFERIT